MANHAILVVEEKGLSRALLESLITTEECNIVCAPGYIEALYKLSKERYDLVMTSQFVNEMSGVELLITAKSLGFVESHGQHTHPVFILFCDTTDENVIKQAWAAGFRHIISRSITRQRFGEILNECIGTIVSPEVEEQTLPPEEEERPEVLPETPTALSLIRILRIEEEEDSVVLYLAGNFSKGSGYLELRETVLSRLRGTKKKKRIYLNFKEVSYVNSSGITGLISLRNEAAKWGGETFLLDAQEQVFNVLARLDLLKTLNYRTSIN